MPRRRTSPETDLLLAAERILDLASAIVNARRPTVTGKRLDSEGVRTVVAGTLAEIAPAMASQMAAVFAIGREVGIVDPEVAA